MNTLRIKLQISILRGWKAVPQILKIGSSKSYFQRKTRPKLLIGDNLASHVRLKVITSYENNDIRFVMQDVQLATEIWTLDSIVTLNVFWIYIPTYIRFAIEAMSKGFSFFWIYMKQKKNQSEIKTRSTID